MNKIDKSKIRNKNIFVQIHLQRYLGLRREESCKFKPHLADKGDHVVLSSSWCKGGRSRIIPINTKEARYWIDEAKKLVQSTSDSLIPRNKKYIEHRNTYDRQIRNAGIKHAHGLRHAYAHDRYRELTGWECPANGGPSYSQLTDEQKAIDRQARLEITEHLGHSRQQVLVVYLGR